MGESSAKLSVRNMDVTVSVEKRGRWVGWGIVELLGDGSEGPRERVLFNGGIRAQRVSWSTISTSP